MRLRRRQGDTQLIIKEDRDAWRGIEQTVLQSYDTLVRAESASASNVTYTLASKCRLALNLATHQPMHIIAPCGTYPKAR